MLCIWIKTGKSVSIPDTKPFSPWNIHHKYPSVLSVGWMLEGMNEEVAFSSFPLMGTNRVSLRVIACGRGERQLQRSSYSQAIPLGGYLHLKHHTERWSFTFFVWMAPVGVKPQLLVTTYRAAQAKKSSLWVADMMYLLWCSGVLFFRLVTSCLHGKKKGMGSTTFEFPSSLYMKHIEPKHTLICSLNLVL